MNGSTDTIAALNDLPIKTANGATIYVRDVAHVSDGFSPQMNIVRMDGQRGVLVPIYKSGSGSTLDIVKQVYAKLPQVASILPPQSGDHAFFRPVDFRAGRGSGRGSRRTDRRVLTALMILLFLGSWRSTLIIAISIPLSVLISIIVLGALHETINIMTLGGLALAVGMLVDDATVAIENIERNLAQGKDTVTAILDGSEQIAIPALVSTLCICIVFVPMFFLTGVAKFLFVPLAEAVVFAMLASYLLSRTLVPTLAMYLLKESPRRRARDRQRHFLAHAARVRAGLRPDARTLPLGFEHVPGACVDVRADFPAAVPGFGAHHAAARERFLSQVWMRG